MPDLRRIASRRALLVLILVALLAAIYAVFLRPGEQALDPGQLAQNNLFQALHALNGVHRTDGQAVDVTQTFSDHLSGMSFPELAQQMNQLGMAWPMTVPPEGSATTIFLAYGMLKKLPDTHFKPDDRITLSFTVGNDGRIKVTKASWANAAAHS